MISFVTWLWHTPGYRSTFEASAVNTLFAMVDRHYPAPHRNICVTNFPKGIDATIEIVPDREDFAGVTNPNGRQNPSCYRRLRVFAPDAGQTFGPRVVSMDLDLVIVGDLRPLVDRPEDFVIWGQSDFPKRQFYNGSLWMLRTGSRTQVWTRFDPRNSPHQTKRAGHRGSDQGWFSYILGRNEATWGNRDGVYSWRVHLAPKGGGLPANAAVVSFHGRTDPWSYDMQHHAWIREHYRVAQEVPA
jgi:hypothetical protein